MTVVTICFTQEMKPYTDLKQVCAVFTRPSECMEMPTWWIVAVHQEVCVLQQGRRDHVCRRHWGSAASGGPVDADGVLGVMGVMEQTWQPRVVLLREPVSPH